MNLEPSHSDLSKAFAYANALNYVDLNRLTSQERLAINATLAEYQTAVKEGFASERFNGNLANADVHVWFSFLDQVTSLRNRFNPDAGIQPARLGDLYR